MKKNISLEETIKIIQKKYKNVPSPLSEPNINPTVQKTKTFEPPFKKALR